MLQRITDLWPNLLRRARGGGGEEELQQLNDGEDSGREEGPLDIDEEELLEDYRLLYWTKLMRIEDYEVEVERKWPLGPDVVEEC